jgi:hypothetical protein
MVTPEWAAHIAQMTRVFSIFLMEERIVQVWPDFLERKNAAIDGKIRDPALVGLGQRPFRARIVEIRNS